MKLIWNGFNETKTINTMMNKEDITEAFNDRFTGCLIQPLENVWLEHAKDHDFHLEWTEIVEQETVLHRERIPLYDEQADNLQLFLHFMLEQLDDEGIINVFPTELLCPTFVADTLRSVEQNQRWRNGLDNGYGYAPNDD
jgi:phenylpropionate dioxygenase-like ring-hydroxylating dioxygenase large terminal subunit